MKSRLSQENRHYLIQNVDGLKQLLAFGQEFLSRFKLRNDLDLRNDANSYIPYLAAGFDEDGHRISNPPLYFSDGTVWRLGLIGISFGQVDDLRVENVWIAAGGHDVGSVVESNLRQGTVSRCYSTSTLTEGSRLVRDNFGSIIDWYSTAGWSLAGFNSPEATKRKSYSTCALAEYDRPSIIGFFWDVQTSATSGAVHFLKRSDWYDRTRAIMGIGRGLPQPGMPLPDQTVACSGWPALSITEKRETQRAIER